MFKKANEESLSPLDQILSSFTKNAREMNSIAGFPGILLLVGLVALVLPVIPGIEASNSLMYISGISILASTMTYTVQWWFMARQSKAQSELIGVFTQKFLNRYLESKQKLEAEHIDWAIENILNKLTKKPTK